MTIDMHAHWLPAAMCDSLRARTTAPMIRRRDDGREEIVYPGGSFPVRDGFELTENRLAAMDEYGIEHGVLSLTTVFGVECLALDEAVPMVRQFNDSVSEMCIAHPGRFSGLAALPMGDLDLAAREMSRALKLPGMIGALLPGDGFLSLRDAEQFRPLFEIAQRHRAHIMVHFGPMPTSISRESMRDIDNQTERVSTLDMQSRLSSNMITFCLTDFLADYPDVTVQSHNLGGNIAFEVERMDHLSLDRKPDVAPPSQRIRNARIWVDCNSFGARAIERAIEVFGAEKIMLGTDGTHFGMEWSQRALAEARISDVERNAILHGNAAAILSRFEGIAVAAE